MIDSKKKMIGVLATQNNLRVKNVQHSEQKRTVVIGDTKLPTTLLFRTTLTQTITLYKLLILSGSNSTIKHNV